jgi:hypothetical protein
MEVKMTGEITLPFGKHRDKPLADVPSDYLRWIVAECKLSAALRKAVADELDRRGYVVPAGPRQHPPRCDRCGGSEFLAFWMEDRAGGRRIRAECVTCRRFMKFLSLTPENIARADAAENPAGMLDLLTQCEDRGIKLASDGARVDFAEDGWRQATPEMRMLVRRYSHRLAGLLGKGIA